MSSPQNSEAVKAKSKIRFLLNLNTLRFVPSFRFGLNIRSGRSVRLESSVPGRNVMHSKLSRSRTSVVWHTTLFDLASPEFPPPNRLCSTLPDLFTFNTMRGDVRHFRCLRAVQRRLARRQRWSCLDARRGGEAGNRGSHAAFRTRLRNLTRFV